MLWPIDVQDFLAAGGQPNFHLAVLMTPRNLTSLADEDLGAWTGWEDVTLPLGGVSRSLMATRGALAAEGLNYQAGTIIQSQTLRLFGLGSLAQDLLKAYDMRRKPASLWQLCFSQGAVFIGARRVFKGFVDQPALAISSKGTTATLELSLASSARLGTRTQTAKKSHASYALRGGDTAMEYASLTDVDSDWWGPKG